MHRGNVTTKDRAFCFILDDFDIRIEKDKYFIRLVPKSMEQEACETTEVSEKFENLTVNSTVQVDTPKKKVFVSSLGNVICKDNFDVDTELTSMSEDLSSLKIKEAKGTESNQNK